MSDFTNPPVEPAASLVADAVEAIRSTGRQVNQAIENDRQFGMPLDILAAKVRGAPIAALSIAFLLGAIVARRR